MNYEETKELYNIYEYASELLNFLKESVENKDITSLKACYYYFEGISFQRLSLREVLENFSLDLDIIKSPIEFLFYSVFYYLRNKNNKQIEYFLQPQVEIGDYVVDFEFVNDYKKIVVECDGHEFHEKTKEQVRKDKKRERDLQKLGYEVVRFSGSEIFENSEKCIYELLEIMKS